MTNKLLFPCSARPGRLHAPRSYGIHTGDSTTRQQVPALTAGVVAGMVGGTSNARARQKVFRSYLSVFTLLLRFTCQQGHWGMKDGQGSLRERGCGATAGGLLQSCAPLHCRRDLLRARRRMAPAF